MITSLKINNAEYVSHILKDKTHSLKIQFESDINNPTSSVYTVSLDNSSNFENIFISEDGFPYSTPLPVKLYEGGSLIFEGELYRNDIQNDPDTENISLKITGKEQALSRKWSNFDISQVFYQVNPNISTRQRGGRTTVRFDSDQFHSIKQYLTLMFGDLGLHA